MADSDLSNTLSNFFSSFIYVIFIFIVILIAITVIVVVFKNLINDKNKRRNEKNKYTPYSIKGMEAYDKQLVSKRNGKHLTEINYQPYVKKDYLLSKAELKFYHVLKEILGDKYNLSSKVRIADIIQVEHNDGKYAPFNKIKAKHVDFLVCNKETMRPKLAIELDDSSHNRTDRKKRDKFVDEVFANAGVPIIHIKVKWEYDKEEIIKQLKQANKNKYIIK